MFYPDLLFIFVIMFYRIWMENECVVKKLTSNMQKDQDTRLAIVVILVVPLFEMPEEPTEEVGHAIDAGDLTVVTDDLITLEYVDFSRIMFQYYANFSEFKKKSNPTTKIFSTTWILHC